jgi:hypothetical protein
MRTVQFYDLARTIQTRFIECARGAGVPAPLAAQPRRHAAPFLWLLAALTAFAALFGFASLGFGELESSLALGPLWTVGVYALLGTVAMYCTIQVITLRGVERSHPYRTGVYVFPVGVVDARKTPFEVHEVTDLVRAEVVPPSRIRVEFREGATFVVAAGNRERAEAAVKALEEAKPQLVEAEETHNRRTLALLDPLQDTGFSNPFSPTVKFRLPKPMNPVAAAALALLCGAALTAFVFFVRNDMSEHRLFEVASARNDTSSWRAYLERGGKRQEVPDFLLPRAELRDARKQATVAAMEKYIASHPNSKIKPEVDSALRAALLEELERVRKAGTLRAVHQFATHYARYDVIRAELEEAKRSVFADALNKFRQRSPDAALESFFERLLEYARTRGPTVHVQFVRQIPDSHQIVDMVVRKSNYFRGTESIPSQYFDEQHEAPRQKDAGDRIVALLQEGFSPEVLRFELQPPTLAQKGEQPAPKLPTLLIEHKTELSGGFLSNLPRAIFVGAGSVFKANFSVPDGGEPWTLKHTAWKSPDVSIMREEGKGTADVYEDMSRAGYDGLVDKLAARLSDKKPPAAVNPASAPAP